MPRKSEISQLIDDVKEEILYIQEMGIDAFDSQIPPEQVLSVNSGELTVDSAQEVAKPPADIPTLKTEPNKKNGSRIAALPSLRDRARSAPPAPGAPARVDGAYPEPSKMEIPLIDTAPVLEETSDSIESIRADIGECTRCPLFAGRTQVVHTTGNFDADLMFIGEAPGADEDAQGFPFVGRAGQLLTKIIEGIGYKREDVAIGNINRCRPPANRAPAIEEAHACRPFLLREINVIRPKVIVVLGNTALHNLLDTKAGITKMRGKFQDYFGVKVMPTFHPAYLLRDPNKKREVWEDMKMVRDYLAENR